jgi:hypothetical protein
MYGKFGKEITDFSAVFLVPITSEKGFQELLEGLGFKAEKLKQDIYRVKQEQLPTELYFRFAHRYVYVATASADALEKDKLIEPSQLFPAKLTSMLSLHVRIDQMPDDVRQALLKEIEKGLGALDATKDKKAGDAQQLFQAALIKELTKLLESAVRDGTELTADVDISTQTKELTADVALKAKPGSYLAKRTEELGKSRSLFTAMLSGDDALNGVVHLTLPDDLRIALNAVIEAGAKKVVSDLKDDAKRKQAERLLGALAGSFKSGEIDVGFSLRGPNKAGQYTLAASVRLGEVEKLTQTLLELLKDLPATEQKLIKLNAHKVGDVAIHEIDLIKGLDADARKLLGDNPLYVAFRKDAAFFALGADGLKAIKEAVVITPAAAPALRVEMSIARVMLLFAKTDEQRAAARKMLERGEDGKLRLSVEGGESLRLRFSMHLSALQLFTDLAGGAAAKEKEK